MMGEKKLIERLSVVIPAYNENRIILDTLKECISSLGDIKPEVIVVDDGSLDGTLEKVQDFAKKNPDVRIVTYGGNQGKGYAVKSGFRYATGDVIAFIDADLNLHPRQIPKMMEYMEKYDVDVVVGSKRHPESKVSYPLLRKILSEMYYLLVRTLFGLPVKDTQVGLKLYKREVLVDVLPKVLVKRYAFDIEILANAHRLGYKIIESPIEVNMSFSSHVNMKAIWNMLLDTSAVFYRMKILKYYDTNTPLLKRNNELLSDYIKAVSKPKVK
ncbi:MAG: glycosyltransferase family 2 protein [Candidatus Methanoperedens sp.]|nr:glycosyltransferase family 2 protein [Candidatus Methanoperedens sp.]